MTVQPAPGVPVSVVLHTADPAAVEPFYRELFGWALPPTGTGAVVDSDGTAVALVAAVGAVGPGWFPVLSAPDDAADRITAAGGQTLGGDAAGLAVADPVGAHLLVGTSPEVPLPPPGPGRAAWFENMTTDPVAADAFYPAVFGLGLAPTDTPEYALLLGPAGPVAGRLALPPELATFIGVRWMVYFAHFDLDTAATQVAALGGTVLVTPRETPTGRVTAVADPGGAVLTLLTPTARP